MAQQTSTPKEWLIISGEPSSDVYGERAIAALPAGTRIRGIGGPRMRKLAPELIDQHELTVSGLTEPFKRLPAIIKLRRYIRSLIKSSPKNVLLMDSPGFNLGLLKQLNAYNHHVIYWLPPQTWAWHESRVKLLKKYVHEVWVLYNFELEHFQSHNVNTIQSYHPLLDKPHLSPMAPATGKTLQILCLPGSRNNEITYQREKFIAACDIIAKTIPISVQLVVHEPRRDIWKDWQKPSKPYPIEICHGLENIKPVHMALATSGTVVLECGLLGIPTINSYQTSWLTMFIAKLVVKIKHLSLPNLIFKEEIFPERIQDKNTPEELASLAIKWWDNPDELYKVREKLKDLRAGIGLHGKKVETLIQEVLTESS